MKMNQLTEFFSKTIFSEKNQDIVIDFSEADLDRLLEDGPIKDIPFIKSIVSVYKTGSNIRTWFMVKKIKRFLHCLEEVSDVEKENFLVKLDSSNGYRNKVLEQLLILIDRLDDEEKSTIVGSLFKATIQGKIEIPDFHKLCNVVDAIYIADLKYFIITYSNKFTNLQQENFYRGYDNYRNPTRDKYLTSMGLQSEKIKTNEVINKVIHSDKIELKFSYSRSRLGDILVKYAEIDFE